ncbi:MAG: peptide chain release factor N(5)-glutamine methyltransferase [Methylotenera sp.]|uniref:peptide chain release factor N(5)-glutamine methyltransferase n=1 Tax=Methylotenera sp. TaxID=2051956 RepID=UPI00271BD845|nr:peptide chain release factor N(5)-glutamine methyltransferase [Methylotenera sp.]MDO9205413.1 peptide chain release factor N(5)-glutamine methyltransferase [Methylotenera sp.]MDO9393720.1 peptide chain release factor N(5)-glutamine methyltransferase [Methylotenera sp.]MDP1523434.1 peptide chain release factor N(5)-glutamine methyltransferase [Methylotenera sp.]MDP2070572.1 peptide chain release factor N(5)-glutamine methyltransferase [Methylotenera sp.]MDP3307975.1 peptide chain release fac
MNIHACLHDAQTLLSQMLETSRHEAKLEAQLLLQHVLKVNRAWLIAHENDVLQPNNHAVFEALLGCRLSGEPMAYILGCREFYGLELMVTPDTLIPRPDTETLVDAALAKIPRSDHSNVLDLGTGTGAIALAIAKHRPQASVTAVDASSTALEVAKKNAHHLKMTDVLFVLSNWFNNITNDKFDVIVSNPPYIEQNDAHLTQGDLRFEPLSALASGIDGLDDIRHIINHCLIYLKPQGWLMLEHGYNQAEQVANLMADTGLTNIETIRDLGGNDRVTIGKNPLIINSHWD